MTLNSILYAFKSIFPYEEALSFYIPDVPYHMIQCRNTFAQFVLCDMSLDIPQMAHMVCDLSQVKLLIWVQMPVFVLKSTSASSNRL